jgi:purine-binding chemotaxis protein CheW
MKKEIRSLLKTRAVAMAIEPEEQKDISTIIEIIEFTLAAESYAIESVFVREVCTLKDFTPLPGVPSFILGIVNLHGQILPVVDLKIFFNLQEKGFGELNKVIILCNDQMEFGILADEIKGTKVIYREEMLPVPHSITGFGEKYLKGITKDHIVVLEAKNILNDEKIIIREEVI